MQLGLAMTGALPALAAMWYVDRLDHKRPEPIWTLRMVAIAGALAVIPCIAIEQQLIELAPTEPFAYAVYHGFVVAAAVEELAKLVCVYWLVWHRPEFDERMDGIVYAARAGLGFALVENVSYLAATGSTGEFIVVFVLRALLAVPGHAIWAGFTGYFAARKRFDQSGPGLLGGYLLAVFLHGAYDAAIFATIPLHAAGEALLATALLLVPLSVIAAGGLGLRRLARHALALDDRAELSAKEPDRFRDPPG